MNRLLEFLRRSVECQASQSDGQDRESNPEFADNLCLSCGFRTDWHFGSDGRWVGHPQVIEGQKGLRHG